METDQTWYASHTGQQRLRLFLKLRLPIAASIGAALVLMRLMCLCASQRHLTLTSRTQICLESLRRFLKGSFFEIKVSECRDSLVVLCDGSLSAVRRQEVKSSTADSEARWRSGRQEPSSYADVHRYSRAVQTSDPSHTCTGNANARTSLCWGRSRVLFRQTTKRFLNWQKGLN